MGFEVYNISEGKILIAHSDERVSIGTIEIYPRCELVKHNRPVVESLFQLNGICVMKIFDDDGSMNEVVLNEGDSIDIEVRKYHIHSNPYDSSSITFFKANGDIRDIIAKIRKNSKM
ncbi:MAG: hypothetical protein ABIG84_00845 [archaeon]